MVKMYVVSSEITRMPPFFNLFSFVFFCPLMIDLRDSDPLTHHSLSAFLIIYCTKRLATLWVEIWPLGVD